MRFRITHDTVYEYAAPASESVGELRLCPVSGPGQQVSNRKLTLDPESPVDAYTDFFGNTVETFAIPFRHPRLHVRMTADVVTRPLPDPGEIADLPVGELRRLYPHRSIEHYFYRLPTASVPLGAVLRPLGRRFLRDAQPLRDGLHDLNAWIHGEFTYRPGHTDVTTPLARVIETRAGVCQDFAHLMLAILRTCGLPARYVSGYIEPNDPAAGAGSELIGAAASHAWVEVALPGGRWWGFDPTNRQCSGERHVRVATGRDYHDVAPLRGTYKGAESQKLHVIVSMERSSGIPAGT